MGGGLRFQGNHPHDPMPTTPTTEELKRAGTTSRETDAKLGIPEQISRLESEAPVHEPDPEGSGAQGLDDKLPTDKTSEG